jgi:hypothetical protein
MASAFGGSSSAFGSYSPPKYSFTHTKARTPHKSGFFGNLLHDAESMATGIPMGLVMSVQHPIRSLKMTAKGIGEEYSPLVHGDFHTFYKRFHAHPLGPILDAVSLATMAVGGLGAGIKAADVLSGGGKVALEDLAPDTQLGLQHVAGTVEKNSDLSSLNRLANHFRPGTKHTTKELPTKYDDVTMTQHYSSNPLTRAMFNKPLEAALSVAGKAPLGKKMFGEKGWYDYTPIGRGTRKLNQLASSHAAGVGTAMHRQMWFMRKVVKDPEVTPEKIADYIKAGAWNSTKDHALKVKADVAYRILEQSDENPIKVAKGQKRLFDTEQHLQRVETPPSLHGTPKHTREWSYLPDPEKLQEALMQGKLKDISHMPKDKSPQEMARFIQSLGADLATDNRELAYRDANGDYFMVHNTLMKSIYQEGDKSYKFMHAMVNSPTRVWKWAVLAMAPRYLVNNMVGNTFMLAAATNPYDFTKAMIQTVHDAHGVRAASRAAKDLGDTLNQFGLKMAGDWQDRWYLGEHHGLIDDLSKYAEGSFLRNKAAENIKSGLYGITSKVAHTAPRRWAINIAISKHPLFRALYKEYRRPGFHGIFGDQQAFRKAAEEVSENPEVRSYVQREASNVMGQYNHFNSLEDKLRGIIPFYSWDRHVMRWAKTMVTEKPGRTDVLLHTGQQGHDQTEKVLGKIPSFMEGAIPLPGKSKHGGLMGKLENLVLGPQIPGRQKILLTSGLNPPTAAADVISSLASLATGNAQQAREKLGSQINPFILGIGAGLTGTNTLTGAKVERGIPIHGGHYGGVLGTMFHQAVAETPGANLYEALRRSHITGQGGARQPKVNSRTGKAGPPPLFAKDVHQELGSMMGFGVRDESPVAATRLYNEEQGISNAHGRSVNIFKVRSSSSFGGSSPSTSRVTGSHLPRLRKHSVYSHPSFGRHPNILGRLKKLSLSSHGL